MGTHVRNRSSQVWVENPSVAWIDGELLKIDGTEAEMYKLLMGRK